MAVAINDSDIAAMLAEDAARNPVATAPAKPAPVDDFQKFLDTNYKKPAKTSGDAFQAHLDSLKKPKADLFPPSGDIYDTTRNRELSPMPKQAAPTPLSQPSAAPTVKVSDESTGTTRTNYAGSPLPSIPQATARDVQSAFGEDAAGQARAMKSMPNMFGGPIAPAGPLEPATTEIADKAQQAILAAADYVPDFVKQGFNESSTGLIAQSTRGTPTFEQSGIKPLNPAEKIAAGIVAQLSPVDLLMWATGSKLAGTALELAGKKAVEQLVVKGMARATAEVFVKKAATGILPRVVFGGAGGAIGGALEGSSHEALRQTAGEAPYDPMKIVKAGGETAVAGGLMAGTGPLIKGFQAVPTAPLWAKVTAAVVRGTAEATVLTAAGAALQGRLPGMKTEDRDGVQVTSFDPGQFAEDVGSAAGMVLAAHFVSKVSGMAVPDPPAPAEGRDAFYNWFNKSYAKAAEAAHETQAVEQGRLPAPGETDYGVQDPWNIGGGPKQPAPGDSGPVQPSGPPEAVPAGLNGKAAVVGDVPALAAEIEAKGGEAQAAEPTPQQAEAQQAQVESTTEGVMPNAEQNASQGGQGREGETLLSPDAQENQHEESPVSGGNRSVTPEPAVAGTDSFGNKLPPGIQHLPVPDTITFRGKEIPNPQKKAGELYDVNPSQLDKIQTPDGKPFPGFTAPPNPTEAQVWHAYNAKRVQIGMDPVAVPASITEAAPAIPETPEVVQGAEKVARATSEPDHIAEAEHQPDAVRHVPREVPLSRISLSKEVPNFKAGAERSTGIIPEQQLKGEFNRVDLAPIVLWERKGGQLEVITGRHRLDLARRSGQRSIPAQVMKESEGFTGNMARALDAESNIRGGQGSVHDYIAYFRNSEITHSEAEKGGLLSRDKGIAAWDAARNATQGLFDQYANGGLSAEKTAVIASAAPGNERLQNAGIDYATSKAKPGADQISAFMRALSTEGGRRKPQVGKQEDLFGLDDTGIQEATQLAKSVADIQRVIKEKIASVSGALKHPFAAKKMGLDVNKPDEIQARVDELKADLAKWDHWETNRELVNQARVAAGLEPIGEKKAAPVEPARPQQMDFAGINMDMTGTPSVKTGPSAPAGKGQGELFETKGKFDAQEEVKPAPELAGPSRPLYEMTHQELRDLSTVLGEYGKNLETRIFGEAGAKEYARLQRIANSSVRPVAEQDAASEKISKLEEGLTEAQQHELFGTGPFRDLPSPDEVKIFRDALGRLQSETAESLGRSIANAVYRVGQKTDPAKMNLDEQAAYAQLREAYRIAKERGFDTDVVEKEALRRAAKMFTDPEDAAFMLRRFAKKPKQTGGPTLFSGLPIEAFNKAVDTANKAVAPLVNKALDTLGDGIGAVLDKLPFKMRLKMRQPFGEFKEVAKTYLAKDLGELADQRFVAGLAREIGLVDPSPAELWVLDRIIRDVPAGDLFDIAERSKLEPMGKQLAERWREYAQKVTAELETLGLPFREEWKDGAQYFYPNYYSKHEKASAYIAGRLYTLLKGRSRATPSGAAMGHTRVRTADRFTVRDNKTGNLHYEYNTQTRKFTGKPAVFRTRAEAKAYLDALNERTQTPGRYYMTEPMTHEMQVAHGLIESPAFNIVKGGLHMSNLVRRTRFLNDLGEMVLDDGTPVVLMVDELPEAPDADTAPRIRLEDAGRLPVSIRQLAKHNENIKRLTEGYVLKSVAEDLMAIYGSHSGPRRLYDMAEKSLRWAATIGSPGRYIKQPIENEWTLYWADTKAFLNITARVKFARDLIRHFHGDEVPIIQEALNQGLGPEGGGASNILKQVLQRHQESIEPTLTETIEKNMLVDTLLGIKHGAEAVYAWEDAAYKIYHYSALRERGMSIEDAAEEARGSAFDFQDQPVIVRKLSHWLPFMAQVGYQLGRIMNHHLRTKPVSVLLKLALTYIAWTEFKEKMEERSGLTAEKKKALGYNAPGWATATLPITTGPNNRNLVVDFSYAMPYYNDVIRGVPQTGQELGSWATQFMPMTLGTIIRTASGKNRFGQDVIDENKPQASQYAFQLADQMPNIYGQYWTSLWKNAQREPGNAFKRPTWETFSGSAVGLKTIDIPGQIEFNKGKEKERAAAEFNETLPDSARKLAKERAKLIGAGVKVGKDKHPDEDPAHGTDAQKARLEQLNEFYREYRDYREVIKENEAAGKKSSAALNRKRLDKAAQQYAPAK